VAIPPMPAPMTIAEAFMDEAFMDEAFMDEAFSWLAG
jgi:hypothetical protein